MQRKLQWTVVFNVVRAARAYSLKLISVGMTHVVRHKDSKELVAFMLSEDTVTEPPEGLEEAIQIPVVEKILSTVDFVHSKFVELYGEPKKGI